MTNKFIGITFLILCQFTLFAQPQNIIDSGDVWQEAKYYYGPQGWVRADHYFKVGGDTLIEGKVLKKLYESNPVWNIDNPTLFWPNPVYFWQDTVERKIYFYNGGEPILWFDFNVTKGDYLPKAPEMYPPDFNYLVTNDTIIKQFSDSLRLLKIEIEELGGENYCGDSLYLIDGIGSTEGFSTRLTHFEDEPGCLVCYSKKGQLVYSGELPSQFCDKVTEISEVFHKNSNKLLISPNPILSSQNNLTIIGEFPEQVLVEIYDFQLRKIYTVKIQGSSPELKLPNLPSGNYTLLITGTNKVARFIKM